MKAIEQYFHVVLVLYFLVWVQRLPPTVESCSDNSIAFWREAPSTTEKTDKSCGVCTPWAWSLLELAELLDELDGRLLWLAGVLCCNNDSWTARMKSTSSSSSISAGWLLRWRPKLLKKRRLNKKMRPFVRCSVLFLNTVLWWSQRKWIFQLAPYFTNKGKKSKKLLAHRASD